METGLCLTRFDAHTAPILCLDVWAQPHTADASYLVTGSADGTARVWNACSGVCVQVCIPAFPMHPLPVSHVLLLGEESPPSLVTATVSGAVEHHALLQVPPCDMPSPQVLGHSRHAHAHTRARARGLDPTPCVDRNTQLHELDAEEKQRLRVAHIQGVPVTKPSLLLHKHSGAVHCLAPGPNLAPEPGGMTPNRRRSSRHHRDETTERLVVVSASQDGTATVVATVRPHTAARRSPPSTRRSSRLLRGGVWMPPPASQVRQDQAPHSAFPRHATRADAQDLHSRSTLRDSLPWSVRTQGGRPRRQQQDRPHVHDRPQQQHTTAVRSMSSDAGGLGGGGGASAGQRLQLLVLEGHTGDVWVVTVGPRLEGYHSDRHRLVFTGGQDTLIRVWNGATGACIRTLAGHSSPIKGLESCLTRLVSASYVVATVHALPSPPCTHVGCWYVQDVWSRTELDHRSPHPRAVLLRTLWPQDTVSPRNRNVRIQFPAHGISSLAVAGHDTG